MEMLSFIQSLLPLSCLNPPLEFIECSRWQSKISDHPQVSSMVSASRRILSRAKVKNDSVMIMRGGGGSVLVEVQRPCG